jgi:ABC-type antimicrobial peptide transport system permease subunit
MSFLFFYTLLFKAISAVMALVSLTGSHGDTATVDPVFSPTQMKGELFDSRHGSVRKGDGQEGGENELKIIYKNDMNSNNNETGNNDNNDNNIKFYTTNNNYNNNNSNNNNNNNNNSSNNNNNNNIMSRSDFTAYRLGFSAAKNHLSICDSALIKLQKMTGIQSSNMNPVIHEPEILQR